MTAFVFASPALVALVAALSAPAAAPAPMRHLEYAVSEKSDGPPEAWTLDVDLTAVSPDHGLSLRLVDRQGAAGGTTVDAHLDRQAGMSVSGDGGFADREEVLLSLFALSFDDLGGLEKGAKFVRVQHTPNGTATTAYEVQSATASLVKFGVKHEVEEAGWTSAWQGVVVYDTLAAAPTRIALTGESALEIRLAKDSFVAK